MRSLLRKPRFRHPWLIALIIIAVIAGAGVWGLKTWYNRNLAPVSSSQQVVYFPVAKGSSLHEIATDLERAGLIRSSRAFETYVRGRQLYARMQAGTYALNPAMSAPQIVDKIVRGEVSKSYLTILPGKTIKQIRQTFKESGYADAELDVAFDPDTYPDMDILADLPAKASLEGYLYPDSFQREDTTSAQTLVRKSLEEMRKHLTSDIVSGFAAQGLNRYQGVTLASIVYQESGDVAAQPTIAQVLLLRLKQGIMLGADVTSLFGAMQDNVKLPKNELEAVNAAINHDSPYNTRMHRGLPPGPISNMTASALKAVASPSNSDFLFFVAGDDGKIHFTRTQAEHEQAVRQYCTEQCF